MFESLFLEIFDVFIEGRLMIAEAHVKIMQFVDLNFEVNPQPYFVLILDLCLLHQVISFLSCDQFNS